MANILQKWIKKYQRVLLIRPQNQFYNKHDPKINLLDKELGIQGVQTKLHHLIPRNQIQDRMKKIVQAGRFQDLETIFHNQKNTNPGIQDRINQYYANGQKQSIVSCVWSSIFFWKANLVYGPSNRNDDPNQGYDEPIIQYQTEDYKDNIIAFQKEIDRVRALQILLNPLMPTNVTWQRSANLYASSGPWQCRLALLIHSHRSILQLFDRMPKLRSIIAFSAGLITAYIYKQYYSPPPQQPPQPPTQQ